MESSQVINKLKILFEKINEPGYVMNNYYADGLINKLASDEQEVACCKILTLLSDQIAIALEHAETQHLSVRVFVTRLLAIVTRKDIYFARLFCTKKDQIFKGFQEISSPNMNPSLRVAYMEVALALVEHMSGTAWIIDTGIWKEILSLCNQKQTVFVVRQTYKFAASLVWKLNGCGDEANLKLIIAHILKPCTDINLLDVDSITDEQEESLCSVYEPMLQMLLSIVSQVPQIHQPNIVISMLIKEFLVVTHTHVIMDRLRKPTIIILCAKVIFSIHIAKMFLLKPLTNDEEYVTEDYIELIAKYYNMINLLVSRRNVALVLDFVTACNVIWMTLCKDIKYKETTPPQPKPANQLITISLVPVLVYIKEFMLHNQTNDLIKYEKIKEYIEKVLNNACQCTARGAYAIRDLMLEMGTTYVTLQSVKRLTCLKTLLDYEQANLVFQALFYILCAYEPDDEDNAQDLNYTEDCQDKVLVMTYVLDTVHHLVKHHNIKWHESLEVICLYNIVYNILKRPNLSCKFIVTALNVIATTVRKFLPPNLSLLMESKPGSTMHELGKLIYLKMHDMHWEVRDSALELLLVCTEISYIKFPPFQKQIMENNLINVAATIAFNDHEFYVQASALKCLGAATKVGAIWDELTVQYPEIQDQIISILRNNQEGIVRKEACSVLRGIYQNISPGKLPATFKQTLHDHMVSSALSDFHWEVQLSALKFWRIVIQSLLTDQGMLDGTFPPVTFSRESRKIVTLNEAEIQKRLLRILDELSSVGCLTVLVKLLHEDTELEIMQAALSISLDLINILDKYKVPDIIKPAEHEASIEELICDIKEEKENDQEMPENDVGTKSDNVIESILNADDINLLANIYESYMKLDADKKDEKEPCLPKVKLLKRASPYLFVNHLKNNDFKAIVEHKRSWKKGIRSVSSLLDDVLGIYEHNEEVNVLDCY